MSDYGFLPNPNPNPIVETELIPPELLKPENFHHLTEPLVSKWEEKNVIHHFYNYHINLAIAYPTELSTTDNKVNKNKKLFSNNN